MRLVEGTTFDQEAAQPSGLWSRYGRDKRIVTIGGGTGPFALLSTLKHYPCSITAIVTMADSGGSSRRLMDEFGQLPFGDLRQALVALSRKGSLWRDVFTFRFPSGISNGLALDTHNGHHSAGHGAAGSAGRGVSGHNLGNLIISALENINEGDLLWALEDAQELLDTAGKVLPVTLKRATLCAQLADGGLLEGESTIDTRGERDAGPLPTLERVFLSEHVEACERALHAIRRADVIVIGPGDLYTSVLPNLLVHGVPEAIRASRAEKVYICNLMTKHGETDGFRAPDFVREVQRYLGGSLDRVIMHDGSFPPHLQEMYAAKQQYPVWPDAKAARDLGPDVVVDQFLSLQRDNLVRHDADRLIEAIFAAPSYEIGLAAASGSPGRI
jgi:uncharacterized cofD-like protein